MTPHVWIPAFTNFDESKQTVFICKRCNSMAFKRTDMSYDGNHITTKNWNEDCDLAVVKLVDES